MKLLDITYSSPPSKKEMTALKFFSIFFLIFAHGRHPKMAIHELCEQERKGNKMGKVIYIFDCTRSSVPVPASVIASVAHFSFKFKKKKCFASRTKKNRLARTTPTHHRHTRAWPLVFFIQKGAKKNHSKNEIVWAWG